MTVTMKIPSWNAAIPKDWQLSVSPSGDGKTFRPVHGEEITVGIGDQLQSDSGPAESCLKGLVDAGYATSPDYQAGQQHAAEAAKE